MAARFDLVALTAKASEIVFQSRQGSLLKFHHNAANKRFKVQVFFGVGGEARESLDDVQAVTRQTDSLGVARFAIQVLIAGPTPSEQNQGLVETITLAGDSTCGGEDFTIKLEQGVATLQFCRQVVRAGVGDDARIGAAIEKTLKQFSTISEVVILNASGDCLLDLSGENRCL